MAQPDLDYMAPEVQLMTSKYVTPLCDVFSVAMVICAIFNDGMSLIQANYNHSTYVKQMDQIIEKIEGISSKLPEQWGEAITRMVSRDTRCRPTLQSFITMKCFEDSVIHCLNMMDIQDPVRKGELFNTLPQTLPLLPTKLLYSTILLTVKEQMEEFDNIVYAVPTLVAMVKNATDEEYRTVVQPELRKLYVLQKPVQATIFLLENLDVLMAMASDDEIKNDILPMVFCTIESNNILGQEAALNVFSTLKIYFDENTIKTLVLPKAKVLFSKASSVKSKMNSLDCIGKLLDSLDKMTVLEEVLPFLLEIQCSDVDIVMTVVDIYEHLLSDKKFGLSHSLLASKVMPSLIPSTALPGLSIEQFTKLMEVLKDMLDEIERQRLSKMAHEIPDQTDIEKRRTSIDLRKIDVTIIKPLITVEDKTSAPPKMRPTINHFEAADTSDILLPPITANRRHSSYQGLEQKEQTALEILYRQRLASKNSAANKLSNFLAPLNLTSSGGTARKSPLKSKKYSSSPKKPKRSSSSSAKKKNPSILVSEPSVNDFKSIKDQLLSSAGLAPSRRPSAGSMTSMSILDMGQRKLSIGGFNTGRRSSFQGMCDQAMQLFTGK